MYLMLKCNFWKTSQVLVGTKIEEPRAINGWLQQLRISPHVLFVMVMFVEIRHLNRTGKNNATNKLLSLFGTRLTIFGITLDLAPYQP